MERGKKTEKCLDVFLLCSVHFCLNLKLFVFHCMTVFLVFSFPDFISLCCFSAQVYVNSFKSVVMSAVIKRYFNFIDVVDESRRVIHLCCVNLNVMK